VFCCCVHAMPYARPGTGALVWQFYQRSFWRASLAAFLTDSGYCR
jgi:hypothetical protein